MWDASRLEQVVTNLLSNAIKFGTGQPIEIRIHKSGNGAELAVTDHGIGIDPARQPFVFERFERAVSWANYGGLGLGLYITRWIVHAHGGRIRVESRLGAGATFIVELPVEADLKATLA
jgi:signal transduction histidine kinase